MFATEVLICSLVISNWKLNFIIRRGKYREIENSNAVPRIPDSLGSLLLGTYKKRDKRDLIYISLLISMSELHRPCLLLYSFFLGAPTE